MYYIKNINKNISLLCYAKKNINLIKCNCIDKCKYTPPSQKIEINDLLECNNILFKIKKEIIINYYLNYTKYLLYC